MTDVTIPKIHYILKTYHDEKVDKLESELAIAKKRIDDLENSIRRVQNSIAIGTWNVKPEMAKFALEIGLLFDSLMKKKP